MATNQIRDDQIRITNLPEGRLTNASGSMSAIRDNLAAVAAPTGVDNFAAGYSVGSLWLYAGLTYLCTGNGVWTQLAVSAHAHSSLSTGSTVLGLAEGQASLASPGRSASWELRSDALRCTASSRIWQLYDSDGNYVDHSLSSGSYRISAHPVGSLHNYDAGDCLKWGHLVSGYGYVQVKDMLRVTAQGDPSKVLEWSLDAGGVAYLGTHSGTQYWWSLPDGTWTAYMNGSAAAGAELYLRDLSSGPPRNYLSFAKHGTRIGFLGFRALDSQEMILSSERVCVDAPEYLWLNVEDLYISCDKLGTFGASPVAQAPPIADATDPTTTQGGLNEVLAALRSYGLIAT